MRYACSIALLVLGFPASEPAFAQAPGQVRTEVEAVVRAYIAAHNKGDAGAIAAMYTTQPGVTSVGDGEIVRGWDRIRERMDVLDSLMAVQGHLTVTLGSLDVTPLGSGYALAIAPYTLTVGAQGTEVRQRGAMTLVLEKVKGEWKIIHDHTSSIRQQAASAGPQAAQPAPGQRAPGAAGQTTIAIANGTASEIPAGQILRYDFQIQATSCTVTGRVEGISGGNKDFEVLILDDDNYRNWNAGLEAKAYGSTGRVTVTNINTPIPGPGSYHLVISNAFSPDTPKAVQVWAQAQCP